VIRYFVLNSHYRGPINYTPENLVQADAGLERLYIALRGVVTTTEDSAGEATRRFDEAMDDDFNTPVAIAELQTLAREVNTAKAGGDAGSAALRAAELRSLGARLGILGRDPEDFLRRRPRRQAKSEAATQGEAGDAEALSDAEIERLIAERAAARKAKNFGESDRIRDLLAAGGVVLEDQPGGVTLWRRGR
jgi:cysteinyl-tRNA synthetase